MKRLITILIKGYQLLVSPLLAWLGGPGSGCRFQPTCSEYCLQAVELHGAFRGTLLGVRRICRCHPWGGYGFDPVPNSCSTSALAAGNDASRSEKNPDTTVTGTKEFHG